MMATIRKKLCYLSTLALLINVSEARLGRRTDDELEYVMICAATCESAVLAYNTKSQCSDESVIDCYKNCHSSTCDSITTCFSPLSCKDDELMKHDVLLFAPSNEGEIGDGSLAKSKKESSEDPPASTMNNEETGEAPSGKNSIVESLHEASDIPHGLTGSSEEEDVESSSEDNEDSEEDEKEDQIDSAIVKSLAATVYLPAELTDSSEEEDVESPSEDNEDSEEDEKEADQLMKHVVPLFAPSNEGEIGDGSLAKSKKKSSEGPLTRPMNNKGQTGESPSGKNSIVESVHEASNIPHGLTDSSEEEDVESSSEENEDSEEDEKEDQIDSVLEEPKEKHAAMPGALNENQSFSGEYFNDDDYDYSEDLDIDGAFIDTQVYPVRDMSETDSSSDSSEESFEEQV